MSQALDNLARAVTEAAEAVREIETRAEAALHGRGDEEGYRALMARKATVLAELADRTAPLVAELPDELAEPLGERIAAFSASARTSLEIGSVFFMSALLYPEDRAPGQPNDLEVFASKIRAMA